MATLMLAVPQNYLDGVDADSQIEAAVGARTYRGWGHTGRSM